MQLYFMFPVLQKKFFRAMDTTLTFPSLLTDLSVCTNYMLHAFPFSIMWQQLLCTHKT